MILPSVSIPFRSRLGLEGIPALVGDLALAPIPPRLGAFRQVIVVTFLVTTSTTSTISICGGWVPSGPYLRDIGSNLDATVSVTTT